jgi:hypothetical protein
MDYGSTYSSFLVIDWSYLHSQSFTLDSVIFETLERDARYSSKTINCSSKARASLPLPLGLGRPPVAKFLTGYLFATQEKI